MRTRAKTPGDPAAMRGVLSMDDLWSVLGYAGLIALGKLVNPGMSLGALSLLASGMLAVFWLASEQVRTRNRYPDARTALWALVAAVSAVGLIGR